MSIYSTELEIKRGRYTIYGQSAGYGINHIVFQQESKRSKKMFNSVIFNVIHANDMLSILQHLNPIGVVHKTYVVSDAHNSYILNVLINTDTVVLYDNDDIITVNREIFTNIMNELHRRLMKYERKSAEKLIADSDKKLLTAFNKSQKRFTTLTKEGAKDE